MSSRRCAILLTKMRSLVIVGSRRSRTPEALLEAPVEPARVLSAQELRDAVKEAEAGGVEVQQVTQTA